MSDIDFGTGANTASGDTVQQALVKLQTRVAAREAFDGNLPTIPTLTVTGPLTYVANAATGSVVGAIGGVPANDTPVLSINDGRLAIAGNATDGWKLTKGAAASTAGTINLTVTSMLALGAAVQITVTAAGSTPTLTLTGGLAFTTATPAGTVIASIGNVPSGVTPTLTPNDGRLVIAGNATDGWKVAVGLTASSAGTIALAVAAAGATGASAMVTVTAANSNSRTKPTLGPQTSAPGSNPLTYDYLYADAQLGDYVQRQLSHNSDGSSPYRNSYVQLNASNISAGLIDWEALYGAQPGGYTKPRERVLKKASQGSGVVIEGNSYVVNGGFAAPFAAENTFVPFPTLTNISFTGRQIRYNSGYNNLWDHEDEVVAANPAVVFTCCDANDLFQYAGATHQEAAQNALNDQVAHWDRLRARISGVRILAATSLPITAAGYENHNLRRGFYNTALKALVGTKIDAVVDWASDPTIGVDSAPNTSYWNSDHLHPSDTGHAIMATYFTPVMQAQQAITDVWTITSDWSTDDIHDTIAANNTLDTFADNAGNGLVLANGSRTASYDNFPTYALGRLATAIKPGDRRIIEFTFDSGGGETLMGLLPIDYPLTSNNHFTSPMNYGIGASLYLNGAAVASLTSGQKFTLGDHMAFCIDRVSNKLYVMKNGVFVFGDPAHEDPADTAHYKPGFDISFLGSTPVYGAVEINAAQVSLTSTTTPPAGFSYGA